MGRSGSIDNSSSSGFSSMSRKTALWTVVIVTSVLLALLAIAFYYWPIEDEVEFVVRDRIQDAENPKDSGKGNSPRRPRTQSSGSSGPVLHPKRRIQLMD